MSGVKLLNLHDDTTHVVVLFIDAPKNDDNQQKMKAKGKKKDGEGAGLKKVDLVPRTWLELMDQKWYCWYPGEESYAFIEQWVEQSKDAEINSWQLYPVKVLREAHSHSQGLRRLRKSFVTEHIESSSQNESTYDQEYHSKNVNSDVEEDAPMRLHRNDARAAMDNIPAFDSSLGENSQITTLTGNDSNTTDEKKKKRKVSHIESISDTDTSGSERNEHTKISKKNLTAPPVRPLHNKTNNINPIVKNMRTERSNDEIKVMLKALESKIEGFKRSIQYDFNKKFEEIKEEIRAAHRPDLTEALQKRSILPPFPKTDLEDFKEFDQQLLNPEMSEALKSFMLLHSERLPDMNSVFNNVIPMIINKNVQMQYSGFGRPTNNVAKENFSTTRTFLIFKEIVLQKFPNTISVKDINSKLSRWLSQAPDRKGGRKERLNKVIGATAGPAGQDQEAVAEPTAPVLEDLEQ